MNPRKSVFLLLSVFSFFSIAAAQQSTPQVHSYIQTRFSSDFDKTNDIMIRRAKLWMEGAVTGMDHVSYKIQTVYRSFKDEAVMFQDALVDVKMNGIGVLRVGRFVPDFMLQRMQPDYEIADIERASVISGMIHNSKSMARQIGVQFTYQTKELPIHVSVGAFNANLESPGKNNDNNLLYTSHVQYTFLNNDEAMIEAGFSAAYRYAHAISMSTIYPLTSLVTGNDLRTGIEFQMEYKDFGIQSEYIQASIRNDKVWGYYIGSEYLVTTTVQATAGVEKYSDLISTTNDNEWYSIGLNYLFTDKTKLMIDFKTQFSSTTNNYLGEIQFQVFLF